MRPAAVTTTGAPEGQRSVSGERRMSAAPSGEKVVNGAGSGSEESNAAPPPTHTHTQPPPALRPSPTSPPALVHVKNVVKYYNTDGWLMSPLKEQSRVKETWERKEEQTWPLHQFAVRTVLAWPLLLIQWNYKRKRLIWEPSLTCGLIHSLICGLKGGGRAWVSQKTTWDLCVLFVFLLVYQLQDVNRMNDPEMAFVTFVLCLFKYHNRNHNNFFFNPFLSTSCSSCWRFTDVAWFYWLNSVLLNVKAFHTPKLSKRKCFNILQNPKALRAH